MLACTALSNHVKSSPQHVGRFSILMLLLVGLITTLCIAQASSGHSGNVLTLSGSLPGGAVHQSYNAVLAVQGGKSPYHFSVASGVLPPGLTMNPKTGAFTGTPDRKSTRLN